MEKDSDFLALSVTPAWSGILIEAKLEWEWGVCIGEGMTHLSFLAFFFFFVCMFTKRESNTQKIKSGTLFHPT